MLKNINNNQQGFSVLLAVLIMSSLTVVTFAASDVILRTGKTTREIGESEIAYYAAETAVEAALYEIEQNKTIVGLDGTTGNLTDINSATWSVQVNEIISYSIDCATLGANQGICVDTVGDITMSNPLKVLLNPNSSFQLDLSFEGFAFSNILQIRWTGGSDGKVIYTGVSGQFVDLNSPVNLNLLSTDKYRIRIINEDSSLMTFSLLPNPNGTNLPIGIRTIGTGIYQGQERNIEVTRTNYQIY